jgi:hypothetical protein
MYINMLAKTCHMCILEWRKLSIFFAAAYLAEAQFFVVHNGRLSFAGARAN